MVRRLGALILWGLLGGAALPPPDAVPQFDFRNLPMCGEDSTAVAAKTVILPGYGAGGFTVRTSQPDAQAFFNNGMQLSHAFAHKPGIAAFVEARRIDPACAMCAWGEAWSSGPTINFGIDDETAKKNLAMVEQAEKLAADGPELEKQLIAALKVRYQGTRAEGDKAFAAAMDSLAKANPANDEIAVLAADALMIASDWKPEQMARPVELLETVLKRNPDYAPAIHFYIHATEGAGFPARAEPYADRLAIVAPSASHLVHMPSHTYYWIGRYEDAATANVRATEMGEQQAIKRGMTKPYAAFGLGDYHWHNVHFGIGGALMAGDSEAALKLARPLLAFTASDRSASAGNFAQVVMGEGYTAVGVYAPAELLASADPGADRPIAQVFWHYARGEAFARTGDLHGLKTEMKALKKGNPAADVFRKVAQNVLIGRYALMKGKTRNAIEAFELAAKAEEASPFADQSDPPIWWYPVRRSLASARLIAGDAAGALADADASLKHRPNDAVALHVRAMALQKLGRQDEANRDLAAAKKYWHGSDAAMKDILA